MAQCAGVARRSSTVGSDLRGPWPSMFGVLFLASAVGMTLGLARLRSVSDRRATAVAVLIGGLPGDDRRAAEGSGLYRLQLSRHESRRRCPRRHGRSEGLLLLRKAIDACAAGGLTERVPVRTAPSTTWPSRIFPAATERMGPKADAMALGFMLIALSSATAFISAGATPVRRAPSSGSAAHRPRDASAGDCRWARFDDLRPDRRAPVVSSSSGLPRPLHESRVTSWRTYRASGGTSDIRTPIAGAASSVGRPRHRPRYSCSSEIASRDDQEVELLQGCHR